jgi:molecular chaperone GrpE
MKIDKINIMAEQENIQEEVVDYKDKYLRVLADFENYKRRKNVEIERIKSEATHEFVKDLLPIVDDVELGFLNSKLYSEEFGRPEDKGIEIINNELTKLLGKYNIEQYGHVGDKFDYNLHEAVYRTQYKRVESGYISEIVTPGYRVKDGKIIRYARVNVEE